MLKRKPGRNLESTNIAELAQAVVASNCTAKATGPPKVRATVMPAVTPTMLAQRLIMPRRRKSSAFISTTLGTRPSALKIIAPERTAQTNSN